MQGRRANESGTLTRGTGVPLLLWRGLPPVGISALGAEMDYGGQNAFVVKRKDEFGGWK